MGEREDTNVRGTGVPDRNEDSIDQTPELAVIEALHNTRRRYAFYYLYKQTRSVDLMDLVRQVAAWERCCQPEEVPVDRRKSVYSALHQTHLPYLERRGLISFDRETNEVKCLLGNSELYLALAKDFKTTIRWHRVHPLVASVGTLVLGGLWAGIPPFDRVSPPVFAGVFVVWYLVVSSLQYYDVYRWRQRMDGMPPDCLIAIDRNTAGEAIGRERGPDRT